MVHGVSTHPVPGAAGLATPLPASHSMLLRRQPPHAQTAVSTPAAETGPGSRATATRKRVAAWRPAPAGRESRVTQTGPTPDQLDVYGAPPQTQRLCTSLCCVLLPSDMLDTTTMRLRRCAAAVLDLGQLKGDAHFKATQFQSASCLPDHKSTSQALLRHARWPRSSLCCKRSGASPSALARDRRAAPHRGALLAPPLAVPERSERRFSDGGRAHGRGRGAGLLPLLMALAPALPPPDPCMTSSAEQ